MVEKLKLVVDNDKTPEEKDGMEGFQVGVKNAEMIYQSILKEVQTLDKSEQYKAGVMSGLLEFFYNARTQVLRNIESMKGRTLN